MVIAGHVVRLVGIKSNGRRVCATGAVIGYSVRGGICSVGRWGGRDGLRGGVLK